MMNQLTKQQKITIAAALGLILVVIAGSYIASQRFKVVSADPAQHGKTNVYSSVILFYNREVTTDNARITTTPSFTYKKAVDGKKLVLTPSTDLLNKTTYTVTVDNICEKEKTTSCVNYKLTFSVNNTIPLDRLSKEQQQQLVRPDDAQYKDSPILSILPVGETNFTISPRPAGTFTYVVITPSVSGKNLTEQEYNAAYAKYYEDGRQYLIRKGYALETSNYKVMSNQEFQDLTSGGD
jgi:hypothetical protein